MAARRGPGLRRTSTAHSRASFDSLASPASLVRTAASRGLTHLAITDHDRIDGALEARDRAAELAPGLTVIVGEEVRTADGDLICLFLERGDPARPAGRRGDRPGPGPGRPRRGARIRSTGSAARSCATPGWSASRGSVDWIETHNARVALGNGNQRAAEFARRARAARDRRLGRPQRVRGRRRLHGPRRRSVDRRRAPRRPARRRRARARPRLDLRPAPDAGREGRPAGPRQRPDPARRDAAVADERPAG